MASRGPRSGAKIIWDRRSSFIGMSASPRNARLAMSNMYPGIPVFSARAASKSPYTADNK